MKNIQVNFLLVLLIIAGLFSGCSKDNTQSTLPVNVIVQKVQFVSDEQAFNYSGTMEESEAIPLSFSTIGNVSRVYVAEGANVKKGQLLAELNNESSKNAYELSLASLKQAEDAYKRLLPMYKNGNLPEIKLVEVETGLQQARSATAMAKKNLDDCRLFSPADGIVGKRSIDPGMTALPNLASITIVKIDKVFARVSISENEIASVKLGAKANIKIPALSNAEYTGSVEEIGVLADPLAHTYKIKIGISNHNREIKPGMICNVTLGKTGVAAGLVVPSQSVSTDEQGKKFVFVTNDHHNKAIKRYVTTAKLLREGVEIIDGLKQGEEIVTAGQQKLVDGTMIHVIQ